MLERFRQTHSAIAMSALAALVFGFATVAAAGSDEPDGGPAGHHWKRHGDHHRGPAAFEARYADRLGLDAEVRAQIDQIVADSKARNDALRDEVRSARKHMHELLEAPDPDETAVMANADQIADIEAEIHKNRIRALLDIRGLLTPAQRQQLVELRAQRDERHGKRHDRGFGACRRDMHEHCGAADGGHAMLGCLHERWDTLPQACRDAFDQEQPEPATGETP